MRIRAVKSFAGAVTMAVDEVRDVCDTMADDLIRCGYAVPEEKEAESVETKRNKPSTGKGKAKN